MDNPDVENKDEVSNIEEKPIEKEQTTPQKACYAKALWGGIHTVIHQRFLSSRKLLKEIANVLEHRAMIEENYGKGLNKVFGNKAEDETKDDSCISAWNLLRHETNEVKEQHNLIAERIRSEVLKPLNIYIDSHQRHKNGLDDKSKKLEKEHERLINEISKAKSKYIKAVEDLKELQDKRARTSVDEKVTATMLQKLGDKVDAQSKVAKNNEKNYKDVIDTYAVFRTTYIQEIEKLLAEYEDQEVEKCRNVKLFLEMLRDILQGPSSHWAEDLAQFATAASNIHPENDVQAFISSCLRTGQLQGATHPPPIAFEEHSTLGINAPTDFAIAAPQNFKKVDLPAALAATSSAPSVPTDHQPTPLSPTHGDISEVPESESPAPVPQPAEENHAPKEESSAAGGVEGGQDDGIVPLGEDVQATAVYPFTTEREDEIALQEGDVVTVLYRRDEWAWCRSAAGREGYCPYTYLQFAA